MAQKTCRAEKKKIAHIEEIFEEEYRRTEMYRKRWQRLKSSVDVSPLTPRSKTRKLLRLMLAVVRRSLFMHNVMMHQLTEKYRRKTIERAKRKFTF